MQIAFIEPEAELRPYIQSLWAFDAQAGLPATDSSIVAPNGCPKLVVPIENTIVSLANAKIQFTRPEHLHFVGNRDNATLLRSSAERTRFVTVEFRPYGAMPILGIPMNLCANGLWNADELFGPWGRRLIEELNEIDDVGAKIARLQGRLSTLLRENGRTNAVVNWCVHTLEAANGRISVAELARETGYTRRHLANLFNEHVGLPPKALAGILRFQRYYRDLVAGASFDAIRDELYDDYYDQAHFTNEFKKMTGYSPRRYEREVRNEFGHRLLRG